jgi:hypothetical protein
MSAVQVEPLWRFEDAAEFFRTSPAALKAQRHRGIAPGSLGVKVGARILYDPDVCRQWVKEQFEGE